MGPDRKKIFISWSGQDTAAIANTWADLLRDLFDFVDPFVSTAVAPGERGLDQIKEALADTQFGVFITTRANQHAPWLNFEAGAISNQANDTKAAIGKVAPCLVDFDSTTDLTSPLKQFQYRQLDRTGVLDILMAIATANDIDTSRMTRRFELAWSAPENGYGDLFAAHIRQVRQAPASVVSENKNSAKSPASTRPAEDMFSEILGILRDLQRREATVAPSIPSVGAERPTMPTLDTPSLPSPKPGQSWERTDRAGLLRAAVERSTGA